MTGAAPSRRPATRSTRLGDLRSGARLILRLEHTAGLSIEQKRHLVADLCRLIEKRVRIEFFGEVSLPAGASTPAVKLSPRMRQTLQRLLRGDSEKEAARSLGLSPHTVHVYIKAIYRKFGVASRGELLARFVPS